MDLKHKGYTWVGNMFQKFEAVCQEMDNIINQDTVKYVENQVSSASENVKKLYSGVVQGLLPRVEDPVKYEAKAAAYRGHVPINAYFKSSSLNEGKAANNVVNKSSVGHGITDQLDNCSRASCKVTFVNEEVAQVPNHSLLEANVDLPLQKSDDVLSDKYLNKNMKGNAVNELLSEESDGTLIDKLAFMESDSSLPSSHSLRNVSSKINDTNRRASSVCDDSDLQLEDDVLLVGNIDEVLTDQDAGKRSEEDTTMEFNASDPLKHMADRTSCKVKVTNGVEILILDNSHPPLDSSRFSGKNDNDLSDENSDEFLKRGVIMEPNATDNSNNNHLSHAQSETNFVSKEADDSNLLLKPEVLSGRIDRTLIDKDFNESPIKDAIFEDDPNNYLLNLPSHGKEVNVTYEEVIMVSDGNHLLLEPELHARMNEDALTGKYSNESLKEDTILMLEHDASYPLKNQPRCTSCCIKYKNEEVSSVSNDSNLKLDSKVYCGKNSEALIDKASDASCKEQANLELSTELISHFDEESIKDTLGTRENECEEDIVTSTGGQLVTSIHGTDVESTHNVTQASSILVNSLVHFSPKLETTSEYLENGTGRSNAPDATSSELVSLVLTSGETVEETRQSLPKSSFFASRSLVKNFSNCTSFHEKPADLRASIEYESRPCFEGVASASNESKALEMKLVSSSSSLSFMDSLGTHASRANESAFLTKFHTSTQVAFSKSTSSGDLSLSTEVGRPYNSGCSILHAEMETVDLGHQVTLKDECDSVDYKAFHAVSRRTQKLRSYKMRIQDAFNSKKRLAKEYEQLAIWYGDIDLEFGTDSSQKLDTKNVSTSYASDSEWELL